MNLIIDIGNNSTKLFLFSGEQIILHTRKTGSTVELLAEWSRTYNIEKAIVSTVIDITAGQKSEIESHGYPVVWFNNEIPVPIGIKYRTPHTLGSDRLAAAVEAASEAPGHNLLVIDAGSAITIDIIDKEGNFCGGNIAPGIDMRLKALHEFTGRLPLVDKEGETPAYGHDTETAIRSGVIKGVCHEINGYINEYKEKYGEVFVFLTGGNEKTLINNIKNRIFADKFLVAKGLNRILTNYEYK
ncbi:MAG: type III pantothenate kinase [Bacteroidaceae bacterium]|nr:type III pantothenate kinase [Bacteroidaceae bacterium]